MREVRFRIEKGRVLRWSLWQRVEQEAGVVRKLEAAGWVIVGRQTRTAS